MFKLFKNIDRKGYKPRYGGLDILKFIGPGLLVTVGFIDPGNWASGSRCPIWLFFIVDGNIIDHHAYLSST